MGVQVAAFRVIDFGGARVIGRTVQVRLDVTLEDRTIQDLWERTAVDGTLAALFALPGRVSPDEASPGLDRAGYMGDFTPGTDHYTYLRVSCSPAASPPARWQKPGCARFPGRKAATCLPTPRRTSTAPWQPAAWSSTVHTACTSWRSPPPTASTSPPGAVRRASWTSFPPANPRRRLQTQNRGRMPQNKRKRGAQMTGQDLYRGMPGYRNRPGRSGLDLQDNSAEASRMEGVLLRKVLTGRARTRSPFYLVLMFLFGFVPFLIILALQIGAGLDGMKTLNTIHLPVLAMNIFVSLIMLVVPGLIAASFVMSILEILHIIPPVRS